MSYSSPWLFGVPAASKNDCYIQRFKWKFFLWEEFIGILWLKNWSLQLKGKKAKLRTKKCFTAHRDNLPVDDIISSWRRSVTVPVIRGGSRVVATSKMERFVIIVNGWSR